MRRGGGRRSRHAAALDWRCSEPLGRACAAPAPPLRPHVQLQEARNRAAQLDRADVYLLSDMHPHRRPVNAMALEGPLGFEARSQHEMYAAVV